MKTTFLTIATLLLLLIAGKKSFATNAENPQKYTELNGVSNFYKIEVHGNVQLHLLSGEKSKVEMNSTYYDHNALVQVENGVLRITCYRTERLNVWVTVNDLHALSAYDNALVQTEGKFSALEFDVELFDKAKANLNLDCYTTNVKLNDRSMADISGSATESELVSNYAATLNSSGFIATEMLTERMAPVWQTRIEFLRSACTASLNGLIDDATELRFSSSSTKPIKFNIPADVQSFTVTQSLIN